MSISNNYIPEKINDFNTYLDGNKMIGVAASVTLPEVKMKTSTVSGAEADHREKPPAVPDRHHLRPSLSDQVLPQLL